MIDSDKVCVVLGPLVNPQANIVNSVATIINKSYYDTSLLITGNNPKIVAYYNDIQTAKQSARKLKALGLVTIVCRESELRKPSQIFEVHTVEIKQGIVLVCSRNNKLMTIEPGNTFLIIKGRRKRSTQRQVTMSKMKINLKATLLTGGIPIFHKVEQTTKETTSETEYFIKLYEHDSMERNIEFLQYDLDYSFLGTEMSSSSFVNLNAIVKKLRNIIPHAIFDERLMNLMQADMSSDIYHDNMEINCKLIYLYYKAVENIGS
jgi:hypothetical protein